MSGRRGRPTKPYRSSDGREVSGLIKLGDGRWRIARLGNTFTEHDERRAVDRATKLLGLASDAVHHVPIASVDPEDCTAFQNARGKVQCATVSEDPEDQNKLLLSQPVAEAALWQWMRDQLIADPVRCAEKTGVADLAKLEFLPLPKKPISLETVLKTYQAHAEVTDQTKKETSNTFTTFIKMTGASTLRELTTES